MQTSMLRGNGTLLSTPEVDIELQLDDLFFGSDMIEEKNCLLVVHQSRSYGGPLFMVIYHQPGTQISCIHES